MLLYALTLAGIAAFVAVHWLQRICERGTYRHLLCQQLKTLLGAFAFAGVLCSTLHLAVLLSNDYEATRRTLGQIEPRLRLYRGLARLFTLTGPQSVAVYAAIAALLVSAVVSSSSSIRRSFRSYLPAWMGAYAFGAWFFCLALFGSMTVAGATFQERLALLEGHAKRIEQRYIDLLARASERLDLGLTATVLSALNEDQQWRAIDAIWRGATQDMKQLRLAYPSLYVASEKPVTTARFPVSPLISIPERIAPVLGTAADAEPEVRLERFAVRFAGADTEDISALQFARGQSIAGAVSWTRAGWSEDNASILEQDLSDTQDPGSSRNQHDLVWRLAGRVGVAMYEEAAPEATMPPTSLAWSALPWNFVKLFLDGSVDDAARDRLAGVAQRELATWLSGQKAWADAAADYAQDISVELNDKVQMSRDSRRRVAQPAVSSAAIEYAAARAGLSEDVGRYAMAAVVQRWRALEQSWMAGVARLPPAPRDSAVKVLVRIRQVVDAQYRPLPRLALLGKIEEAWRTVVASLASEEQSAVFDTVAAAVIAGESLMLGSRRFADENQAALLKAMSEAAREHFGETIGRMPKASEGYKLDAYLRDMFVDSHALTSAALQRLSRNADATQRTLLLAGSTRQCMIEGNLTTSLLQEGLVASRTMRRVSIPCW
jgi:hypothetical protein